MRRPYVAFGCFLVGLLLILVVELPIARIVGVPLMFVGIALGVAVIASPDFLERDLGSGSGEE
jgi:disulfide bond formation protein DsbB